MPPLPEAVALCAGCHRSSADSWWKTPHRRTLQAPRVDDRWRGCQGCHRGTDLHLKDMTVKANQPRFAGLSAKEITDRCLTCHRDSDRVFWMTSTHSRLHDSCLDCHSPHHGKGQNMLKQTEPELCYRCHSRQKAEGRLPSHHPIEEGKMVCSDCHNPHGDQRGNVGQASNPELCFKCHAEKEGPFVFEHSPVTEDCLTCHRPHGSPVDNLLVRNEPGLCLQCHAGHFDNSRGALVPFTPELIERLGLDPNLNVQQEARHSIAGFYTKCSSCHSDVHGTDLQSQTGNPTLMPGGPNPFPEKGPVVISNQLDMFGFSGAVLKDRSPAMSLSPRSSVVSSPISSPGGQGPATNLAAGQLALSGLTGAGVMFGDGAVSGNPQRVREYDGKNYNYPDLSISQEYFTPTLDTYLNLQGPFTFDESVQLGFGSPYGSFDLNYNRFRHRFDRFNDTGEALMPHGRVRTEEILNTDLTDGKNDFGIDRQALSARMKGVIPGLKQVRWLSDVFFENEQGSRQFLFLSRCDGCHKIQVSEPIDRTTVDADVGLELLLGQASVRYLHNERRFDNHAPNVDFVFPESRIADGQQPLIRRASSSDSGDNIRFGIPAGDRFYGYGLWEQKERDNTFSGAELDVKSRGGGLSSFLSRDLLLTVDHFSRSFDVSQQPALIFNRSLPPPSLVSTVPNTVLNRDKDTTRVGLRYNGLKNTTLSFGFRREDINRKGRFMEDTSSDLFNLVGTMRPLPNLYLQGVYENTHTDYTADDLDQHLRIGPPTTGRRWSVTANYDVSDRLLLSALASSSDQSWKLVGEETTRTDNSIDTGGISLYFTPNRRVTVDASAYWQTGRVSGDATFGTATFSSPTVGYDFPFPPIPGQAIFDYQANVLQVGGSWWATPKLRLFGRASQTKTDGKETLKDIGDYLDLNPDLNGVDFVVNPFDVTIRDLWGGIGYLMNPTTEVVFSYQRRGWRDPNESFQKGVFRVWRFGVMKRF